MHTKKPAIILTALFFSSFAVIAALAFLSKSSHEKKNGFNRRLFNARLSPGQHASFPVIINRLIGSYNGQLYFQGNSPYQIYSTDLTLGSLKTIPLSTLPDTKLNSGVRMYLQGRHLYISCRNLPGIIDYDLATGTSQQHTIPYFYSKEAYILHDRFILRANDQQSKEPLFVKLNLENTATRVEDRFSEKSGNNGFSTDGILYYDTTTHQACYTYFYRNGFICMDTNLTVTLKARTLDTVTKRTLQIAHVGTSFTMNQPPPFVNYAGAVAAGNLFLQSMLKADNEYPLDFRENTVIDIYSLTNGAYKGSFYIPAYNEKAIHQFHVIDKKLYAIYGKTVVRYDLNLIEDL
jgi:hypothetical protein